MNSPPKKYRHKPEHFRILDEGVEVWNKWRKENPDITPNLFKAALRIENLVDVNLKGATLRGAYLAGKNLSRADLSNSDLTHAVLWGANLTEANLSGANLQFAALWSANFIATKLHETNFAQATIGWAVLAGLDLSTARNLATMNHRAPSTIGIDTLHRSDGNIPEEFLRNAGVPEAIIDVARSLRAGSPIQWHSCFISYSTKDEEFARRLHGRMRQAGLRVWFAPEDAKGGEILHEQLFRAIQLYDKLLLVLFENSIRSEWVMTEIRKAREAEKKENRRKLFPIRLVDFDTLHDWTCFNADTGKDLAVEVREYFIPDFSNWKDHETFESAFARLLNDLKAEESKKS